jgi:hypothetical protein
VRKYEERINSGERRVLPKMIDAGYLFLYENKEWKKKPHSPPKKIEKRTKKKSKTNPTARVR